MKIRQNLRGGAAAAAGTVLFMGVSIGAATQAAAPTYEREIAGIRLNSTAKSVLAKYGNPNEVVIGAVGVRQGTTVPGAASAAMGEQRSNFAQNGPPGGFNGPPGGGFNGPPGGGFNGPPGGAENGPPGGFQGGAPGGFEAGGRGGFGGGTAVGPFGNTQSSVATEQEVTWIYNRKYNDKKGAPQLVSYEFLVGPAGNVEQIRVSGYTGGNVRTARGIVLGSTYRDVIRTYGFPEEHEDYGNVLVTSYRNSAHVQFQFLNDRVLSGNVTNPGNKVIGITIASVE